MRSALSQNLLRVATRSPRAPVALRVAPQATLTRALSTSTPLFKKSKAAAVKNAVKAARANRDVDPEAYEKAQIDVEGILAKAKDKMIKAVDRTKGQVYEVVERARGRIHPSLLDPIKVLTPDVGNYRPLVALASVTVKNSALMVDVWDPSHLKHVESAIHDANLPGISPVRMGDNLLKIPIAKPTHDQRQALLKEAGVHIEGGKSSCRKARGEAMDNLGGRRENGSDKIEKMTEQYTNDLVKLHAQAKKEFDKV